MKKEEKINLEQIQKYNKLISKYIDHTKKVLFKTFISIAFILIFIEFIFQSFFFNKILLITYIILFIIAILCCLIYKLIINSFYVKLNKSSEAHFSNNEYLEKKYIFENNKLIVYTTDKEEYTFNNYYKVFIDQNEKTIVIQFYKHSNKKMIAFKYNNLQEFVKYFEQNNIKYKYK